MKTTLCDICRVDESARNRDRCPVLPFRVLTCTVGNAPSLKTVYDLCPECWHALTRWIVTRQNASFDELKAREKPAKNL